MPTLIFDPPDDRDDQTFFDSETNTLYHPGRKEVPRSAYKRLQEADPEGWHRPENYGTEGSDSDVVLASEGPPFDIDEIRSGEVARRHRRERGYGPGSNPGKGPGDNPGKGPVSGKSSDDDADGDGRPEPDITYIVDTMDGAE